DYIDIVCSGEDCKECKIYVDNQQIEKQPELFKKRPKVHRFDENGYLEEKKYKDEICFTYQIFSNNSSTNMFLEYDSKYYVFYSSIKKTEEFNDYDEALKAYDPKDILPTENSHFYKD
ncbi:MAG: hypothetical protein OIF32_00845, partial [Campylobacterales bacterium]|nr:hypothetical protein [Campylobacterales bacterium]